MSRTKSSGLAMVIFTWLLSATPALADLDVHCSGNRARVQDREGHEIARIQIPAFTDADPRMDAQPELGHLFGAGSRYRWSVKQAGLEGEVWLSTYDLHGFVLIGGELRSPDQQFVIVNGICPCTIEIERDNYDRSRIFINSGNQGHSGSLALSDDRACVGSAPRTEGQSTALPSAQRTLPCSTVCAFRGDSPRDCLGIGFVSMQRAEGTISRQRSDRILTIQPELAYTGIELPAGQTLNLETLLIDTSSEGGTRCLEEWADVAAAVIQPRFNRAMVGGYNTWYAYWTPQSNHGTADLWMKGADELKTSGLIHYGISATSAGVWQNRGAFGESETWPNLIPKGWKWSARQIQDKGIQVVHGGFWGHVSECATVFKEHPEWMVKNKEGKPIKLGDESWGACPYPYYDLDVTNPSALDWLKSSVQECAGWGTKLYWIDFYGYAASRAGGAAIANRNMTWPTEAERMHLRMIRDTLGDGCSIGTYTSPTNRLVGVADRVRMSVDAGLVAAAPADGPDGPASIAYRKAAPARWKGIEEVARNMAAAFFYNQKLWINDPDPIAVGLRDQPATLEEARVRMMICACSGGFPTIGESPTKMDPGRLALLKKALPVYGHAARAVDLLDRDVATLHHLHVRHPAGDWEVITLFNWDPQPRNVNVDLATLGIIGPHHEFEFWTQKYAGIVEDHMTFEMPAYACRVLRLTPVANRPQVIGSDRHVTVGYPELPSIQWSEKGVLSGVARRPQPEQGAITIHVPPGWKIARKNGLDQVETEGALLRARLSFPPEGRSWQIGFEH